MTSFWTFSSVSLNRGTVTAGYSLEMFLSCAMAAFLTGKKSFYDMSTFAGVNKDLLIELSGVSATPSHDTFTRIFRILDRKLSALCLQKLSGKIGDIMARHVVAIDGKTCGRAREAAHIIRAWSPGEKTLPEFAGSKKKAMKFQLFRNFLIFLDRH